MASGIARRPALQSDREFLYELLKRALGPQIVATYGHWDEGWQRDHFLKTTNIEEHEILESNGNRVGCLLVSERPALIELQRILLLPEHQNLGIGTSVVREVLSEARNRGATVRLQVFRVSPALRFYERLGFQRTGQTTTHVLMEHAA